MWGYHAAKFLREEDDARITAIIERDGAILNDSGLDPDAVRDWIGQHGGVKGFPGGEYTETGAAVLERDCDILIPAALEGVINRGNADRIRAPLIIEAANGPITAGGDEILREKGVVIIPDLLCECRRRDSVLFRMGQEPVAYPLRAHAAPQRGSPCHGACARIGTSFR